MVGQSYNVEEEIGHLHGSLDVRRTFSGDVENFTLQACYLFTSCGLEENTCTLLCSRGINPRMVYFEHEKNTIFKHTTCFAILAISLQYHADCATALPCPRPLVRK